MIAPRAESNLFVVQGVVRDVPSRRSFADRYRACCVMLVALALVAVFPQLAPMLIAEVR